MGWEVVVTCLCHVGEGIWKESKLVFPNGRSILILGWTILCCVISSHIVQEYSTVNPGPPNARCPPLITARVNNTLPCFQHSREGNCSEWEVISKDTFIHFSNFKSCYKPLPRDATNSWNYFFNITATNFGGL